MRGSGIDFYAGITAGKMADRARPMFYSVGWTLVRALPEESGGLSGDRESGQALRSNTVWARRPVGAMGD